MESTTLTNSIKMDESVVAELRSASLEFKKIIDACKEKGCDGDCITIIDELREALSIVQKCVPICRKIEAAGAKTTRKEEMTPLVDQSGARKRKREEEDPVEEAAREIVKVTVPAEKMGHVIGSRMTNKKRLEMEFGVRITLPDRGGSEIEIEGPSDQAFAAKKDILENLPVERTQPIEGRFIGAIIGTKGETIKGLRREFKVNININTEEEVVTVSGMKDRCDDALRSIKNIIKNETKRREDALHEANRRDFDRRGARFEDYRSEEPRREYARREPAQREYSRRKLQPSVREDQQEDYWRDDYHPIQYTRREFQEDNRREDARQAAPYWDLSD